MKELIIRMRNLDDMQDSIQNKSAQEISTYAPWLEFEYDGIVYDHLKNATIEIEHPKYVPGVGLNADDWRCQFTFQKDLKFS